MRENKLIKPPKLKQGDTIGIISPAGAVKKDADWESTIKYFEDRGYKVKLAPHSKDRLNYLAGCDKDRLNDFMSMFEDKEVNAIMCSRGGYGVFRLLESIDWQKVYRNPKIFVGYSDITALLNTIVDKSGLVCFHGPLAISDFGCEEINPYTEKTFWDILERKFSTPYKYENPIDYECINKGEAEGSLTGGNLALMCGLLGTPYFPDLENKILLLEDVGEPIYKIDRMLMQLKLSGVLNKVSGILFGEFTLVDNSEDPKITRKKLTDLLKELLGDLSIPIGFGFPAGHGRNKATLPLGCEYYFNSQDGQLVLTQY